MTGVARSGNGWFARLSRQPRRYLTVDGGSGALPLTELAGLGPYLQPVATARHADFLLIAEPISRKLAPSVVELARAMPRPARALLVGNAMLDHLREENLIRVEELLPGVQRTTRASLKQSLAVLNDATWPAIIVPDEPKLETTTVSLPPKQERELATELIVLSLGPIQPFTAGPLRLLLVCDGEQVLSVQLEAGYARRGVTEAMMATDWREAAALAQQLDPLAPVASRLAYIRALEQLQGWRPPTTLSRSREAALALERAQNHLGWLVRFTTVLTMASLADRACALLTALTTATQSLWPQPAAEWLAPQRSVPPADVVVGDALWRISDQVQTIRAKIEKDRLLGLRTRGIGAMQVECLRAAGVTGAVLQASERGAGDVQDRLLTRLDLTVADLRSAAENLAWGETAAEHPAHWEVHAGEAHVTVEGPRGGIGLRLVSVGAEGPAHVEWQRPSAALLALIPELLAGQKLADTEATLASLDLAMAEADG